MKNRPTTRRGVLALAILAGTAMTVLAVAWTLGGGAAARAESTRLALDIYTADAQGLGTTSVLVYGDSVLLKRFPGTPVYASASDIEYIRGDLASTAAQIRARFGADSIPADIHIPQAWPSTHFTVDGEAVDVIVGL